MTKKMIGIATIFVFFATTRVLAQESKPEKSATTYTITISAVNGTVAKSPDKTNYAPGEKVTLSAIPNTGYVFSRWTGSAIGKLNPLSMTINSNRTITAIFVQEVQSSSNGIGQPAEDAFSDLFKDALKEAEGGDAEAQYVLGAMYCRGDGVSQDYKEAIKWFSKAAEKGVAPAQFGLGVLYAIGKGVLQDDQEAAKWCTKAAGQGNARFQYILGSMYEKGFGVPQDDKEAVKWYSKAANQGDAFAQCKLGSMYSDGQGVPPDDKEALKWYTNAAEQGHILAQYLVSSSYGGCLKVQKDEKLAAEWKAKSEHGGLSLKNNWNLTSNKIIGVPRDDNEMVRLRARAVEQGDAEAQFDLGVMYAQGVVMPQNSKEASEWYLKLAELTETGLDFGPSQYGEKDKLLDYKEAVKWFIKSAEQGFAKAQFNLGVAYDIGVGVAYNKGARMPQNLVEAYKWYSLAAAQGEEKAVLKRENVRKILTQDQLAEAKRLSKEFIPKRK